MTGALRQACPVTARFRLPVRWLDAVLFDLDVLLDGPAQVSAGAWSAGVTAAPGAAALLARLRDVGVSTAVLTARPDAAQPLAAAGLDGLVTAVVDGEEIGQAGLAALPDPAAALHAAARLGTHPMRTGIVHAEPAGVQAACRGGFGLVVGVDRRGGQETVLCAFGAETVLTGVDALTLDEDAAQRRWWQVPQRGRPWPGPPRSPNCSPRTWTPGGGCGSAATWSCTPTGRRPCSR